MDLITHVVGHPPRCLAGVRLLEPTVLDSQTVRFPLSADSGERWGHLLGHDLRTLNPEYDGDPLFVTPLFVQWQGASRPTLLLDTDIHGYHGELGGSAKFRGSGDPDTLSCAGCGADLFVFDAEFHYWDDTVDQWTEEPEMAVQNYFSVFTLHARCRACDGAYQPCILDL